MNCNKISEIAKKYTEYDVIVDHAALPAFPDLRIRLLFAFLANERIPYADNELYGLVAGLVQLGMDTHDTIDADSGRLSEREMRSRQLKVLAGDYFSSRFYQLLAHPGRIEMIRSMSDGVCEVNRLKMNLYMKMKQLRLTTEEYLHQCVQVNTRLFYSFSYLLNENAVKLWSELLETIGRCEVIASELAKCEDPLAFVGSWGYWHVWTEGNDEEKRLLAESSVEPYMIESLIAKYNIRGQLAEQLNQSVQIIQAVAARVDSERIVQELTEICEQLMSRQLAAASVLGERR
ncbi:heptaprenyl diphosphate synthase component 1 [Paenibacillus sp. GCM10027626]|uniref:heptaprenyl diphosphate synthase component 1 n=1 Tax=Paenibacillus sp. GCM10027626 TaxID=3273411 RepID=UPI00363A8592